MNETEKTISKRGGLQVGSATATYPFAKLYVDENILKIKCMLFDTLEFTPEDIEKIEAEYSPFKIGVRIRHTKKEYNPYIIFGTSNPDNLIIKIKQIGFYK